MTGLVIGVSFNFTCREYSLAKIKTELDLFKACQETQDSFYDSSDTTYPTDLVWERINGENGNRLNVYTKNTGDLVGPPRKGMLRIIQSESEERACYIIKYFDDGSPVLVEEKTFMGRTVVTEALQGKRSIGLELDVEYESECIDSQIGYQLTTVDGLEESSADYWVSEKGDKAAEKELRAITDKWFRKITAAKLG